MRAGRASGYQFIGSSKTAQNTYSNMEISPALGDADATTGQNCQAQMPNDCPTVRSEKPSKGIAQLRMCADAKNLKRSGPEFSSHKSNIPLFIERGGLR